MKHKLLLLVLGSLVLPFTASLLAHAQSETETYEYSRLQEDPLTEYGYDAMMQKYQAIKDAGAAARATTGQTERFLSTNASLDPKLLPLDKDTIRQRIINDPTSSQYYNSLLSTVHAHWGVDYSANDESRYRSPAQTNALANGFIWYLGEIPGKESLYQHTMDEYGQEAARHLNGFLTHNWEFQWEPFLVPVAFDIIQTLYTDTERDQFATKMLDYAEPDDGRVKIDNTPHGWMLLGALLGYGHPNFDQNRVNTLLSYFDNGLVFGDPADMSATHQASFHSWTNFLGSHVNYGTLYGEGFPYTHFLGSTFYAFLLPWLHVTKENYFLMEVAKEYPLFHYHWLGNNDATDWLEKTSLKDKPWGLHSTAVQGWLSLGLLQATGDAEAQRNAQLGKQHLLHSSDYRKTVERIFTIVFDDQTVPAKAPKDFTLTELPLTRHFRNVNHVSRRANWTDSDATIFRFFAPTFNGRNTWPSGSFSLIRGAAPLTTPTNRQDHHYAGGNTHNTFTAYKGSRAFIPLSTQDRSQGRSNRPQVRNGDSLRDFNDPTLGGYLEGLRFLENVPATPSEAGYLYAFIDGGKALELRANSDCCQGEALDLNWNRELLFLPKESSENEDIVIVFDRVAKGEGIEFNLVFQQNGDVEIHDDGAAQTGVSVHGNDVIKFTGGSDRIVTTNQGQFQIQNEGLLTHNARLFTDTLYPKNEVVYYKVGGDNPNINIKTGDPGSRDLHSDWATMSNSDRNNYGQYRVEVTKEQPEGVEKYLHVLQATDAGTSSPLPSQLVQGTNLLGTAVRDTIALFNPNDSPLVAGNLTFDNVPTGTYDLLIAGLEPETSYNITIAGNATTHTSKKTGTIFLEDQSISGSVSWWQRLWKAHAAGTAFQIVKSGTVTNTAPMVTLGNDFSTLIDDSAFLDATVTDDGLPLVPGKLSYTWSQVSGPGSVTFANSTAEDTTAQFSAQGVYTLRLTVSDGEHQVSDELNVTVIGLLAYWSFNAGNPTTATDETGNGFDGVINGATVVDGPFGKALDFDGTDDMVTIDTLATDALSTLINRSIAWTHCFDDYDTPMSAVSKSADKWSTTSSFNIGFATTEGYKGSPRFISWNDTNGSQSVLVASQVALGDCHRGVVTIGESHIRIYRDGVLLIEKPRTITPHILDSKLTIGAFYGISEPRDFFDGIIDEVCIYEGELTQAAILAENIKPCGSNPPAPPPAVCITGALENRIMDGETRMGLPNVHITLTDTATSTVAKDVTIPMNASGNASITNLSGISDSATYNITVRPHGLLQNTVTNQTNVISGGCIDAGTFELVDANGDGQSELADLVGFVNFYKTKGHSTLEHVFAHKEAGVNHLVRAVVNFISQQ